MSFQFHPTAYSPPDSRCQIRHALEKHTELASRSAFPQIWDLTDHLNSGRSGSTHHNSRLSIALEVCCLILGLILLPVGLSDPREQAVPLFFGVFAVVYGLLSLLTVHRTRHDCFDRSTDKLISGLPVIPESSELRVCFSDERMEVQASSSERSPSCSVPYSDFHWVLETADLYLCIYDSRYLLLQKKDLMDGTPEDFTAFLSERLPVFSV